MLLSKLSGTPGYWQPGPGRVRVMPNLLNSGPGRVSTCRVPGYFITRCNTNFNKSHYFEDYFNFFVVTRAFYIFVVTKATASDTSVWPEGGNFPVLWDFWLKRGDRFLRMGICGINSKRGGI